MIGFGVLHQALVTPDLVARIKSLNNPAAKFFGDLMGHFTKAYQEIAGVDAAPVHAPATIAYLTDSSIVQNQAMYTAIELRSEKCCRFPEISLHN